MCLATASACQPPETKFMPSTSTASLSDRNARRVRLGWSAFVACSWTWCIGMFLPVLLVRDYGVSGWIVFALPNVVGAAAMGWVLAGQSSSPAFVALHRWAAVMFSIVTLAFHAYFVSAVLGPLFGYWTTLPCAGLVAGLALLLRGIKGSNLVVAGGVLMASLVALGLTISMSTIEAMGIEPRIAISLTRSVLWLAPISCFGFFLCPYLDLTFHRARQANTAAAARMVFAFGFGSLFLLMILFTLIYTQPLCQLMATGHIPRGRAGLLLWIVLAHLLGQSAYTMVLHWRELAPLNLRKWRKADWALIGLIALTAVMAGGADRLLRGLCPASGECGYRFFMVFYGLLFPTYVYLCAIPDRRGAVGPTRKKLALLGIVVVLCLPLYWMAFLRGQMIFLAPATVILAASRWMPMWSAV